MRWSFFTLLQEITLRENSLSQNSYPSNLLSSSLSVSQAPSLVSFASSEHFPADQGFIFTILQNHNVIKGTTYWTATNVADGLQALCTCVEVRTAILPLALTRPTRPFQMVIFSALMLWSFSSKDYRAMREGRPHTNSFMAFLHSQNYWDFIKDSYLAIKFFVRYALGRPDTHSAKADKPPDFDQAFGVDRYGRDYSSTYGQGASEYGQGVQVQGGANVIVVDNNAVTLNGNPVYPTNGGEYGPPPMRSAMKGGADRKRY